MSPGNIFAELSPHARVITAVLPFALAIFTRLLVGNNLLTLADFAECSVVCGQRARWPRTPVASGNPQLAHSATIGAGDAG
jgi:hypothetical protein